MLKTLAVVALGVAVTTAAPGPGRVTPRGRVVVIGMPGLRWSDVTSDRTPALYAAARRGATGALSVRTGDTPVTGERAGWLSVGAGNRARTGDDTADFDRLRRVNDKGAFAADVYALGRALAAAGQPVEASGEARFAVGAPRAAAGAEPTSREPVVRLLARPEGDLSGLDHEVDRVLRAMGANDTLLVIGVSDAAGGPAALHVAIAAGPAFGPGRLTSASTRRAPYVQLIDVGPTVLDLVGVEQPNTMVGQPWRRIHGQHEVADLVDAQRAAEANRRFGQPFLGVLAALFLLMCCALWPALRLTPAGAHPRIRAAGHVAVVAFFALIPATYLAQLVPWWRGGFGALVATTVGATALVTALALAGPWRRLPAGPVTAVAATTTAVIAVDLLTGAHLQLNSLLGYSPLVAGRFAGIGNVAFGVLAAAALLSVAVLLAPRSRRQSFWGVVLAGGFLVVLDGSPVWGSDFGGVLALVPGVVVLALLLTRRRLSWRPLLLAAVGGVVVVATFALLDYSRPASSRTHLGRFVAQVRDGHAGVVIRRKAEANLHLLTHSALTFMVPIAVLFLALVLLRPWGGLRRALDTVAGLRAGLVAVLVTSLVGFATNDSGVAVPSMALAVCVPFATAVSLRVVRRDEPDPVLP